jgi:hypothetical protein
MRAGFHSESSMMTLPKPDLKACHRVRTGLRPCFIASEWYYGCNHDWKPLIWDRRKAPNQPELLAQIFVVLESG